MTSGAPGRADTVGASLTPTGGGPPELGRRRAALARIATDYAGVALVLVKSVVLVPIYVRSFGLATYGAWLATGSILALVGMLEGGFTLVFAQRLSRASGQRDWRRFSEEAGSGATLLVATALLIGAIPVLLARWVPGWVHIKGPNATAVAAAFALAGGGLGLSLAQSTIIAVLAAWQHARVVFVVRMATQLLELVAILVGLLMNGTIVVLGAASLLSGAFGVLVVAPVVVARWREYRLPFPRPTRRIAGALAAEGLPVFVSRAGTVLLNNNEPLIAGVILGPVAAGVYGLTDRVFKIGQMLVSQAANAVVLGLAHLSGAEGPSDKLGDVVNEIIELAYVLIGIVFFAAIALNPSFVAVWVGEDKFAGKLVSTLSGCAAILAARNAIMGSVASGMGSMVGSAVVQVVEVLVRVPLLLVLVSRWGLVGFPVAALASTAMTSLWLLPRLIRRSLPGFRTSWRNSAVVCGACAGVGVGYGLPVSRGWGSFCGVAAGVLAGAGVAALALSPRIRAILMATIRPLT